MTPNRLITIAIHTYEKALPLKNLLEREGIYVELNNVNLATPVVSPGVRIRIKESDLPLALRIIENIEIFEIPNEGEASKLSGKILVPTDFSPHADKAARMAFILAQQLGLSIEFLYSFIAPESNQNISLADSYDYQLSDMEAYQAIQKESNKLMNEYLTKVRDKIKNGELPGVKFTSTVVEGIPEEAILEYAREKHPQLIVMGTRGAEKKESELIGSVTAEVLDSCRIPAFTVPENVDDKLLENLDKVAFICNLDQEDMIALDSLNRLFPEQNLSVTLIHIPGKHERMQQKSKSDKAKQMLLDYCREQFPRYQFNLQAVSLQHLTDDFKNVMSEFPFRLICVPNKKRNVFARVFNPSIAHKILFRADIPMVVIPV